MESPREWKSGKIFLSGVFPYSVTPVFAISFRIRISCLASLISEAASVFECTEISKSCCQYKWNQSPREIVITNRFFPACYKRLCHLQEIPAKRLLVGNQKSFSPPSSMMESGTMAHPSAAGITGCAVWRRSRQGGRFIQGGSRRAIWMVPQRTGEWKRKFNCPAAGRSFGRAPDPGRIRW